MARRSFSRTNPYARYLPFGLFGGQISGAILCILSLFVIIMSSIQPGWFDTARRNTNDTLLPLLSALNLPFRLLDQGFNNIFILTQIRAEADNLREENRRLQEWYNVAQLLKAENHSLRSLLKVRVNQSLSTVTVQVIGDTSGPYGQTILIDGGENEQLNKGDAVLGGEGLIGRILSVNQNTSTILLMTDVSSRIPVRIDGSNIQGILTGTGGQDLTLTRLPEGSQLNEGERIITSGIGGVFPPDLPVGTVRIQKNGRISVTPFADFGRLVYVRVVRMQSDIINDPLTNPTEQPLAPPTKTLPISDLKPNPPLDLPTKNLKQVQP